MPIQPEIRRHRARRRWLFGCSILLVVGLATVGLARLKPAAPLVERSSLWMDTVRRGEMLRQVRGTGTLVPVDIRWIPTSNAGRVERIMALPGARVQADTVLVELSNPEVDQAAFDAEWQLKGAEAELASLRVQMKTDKLTQQKNVATAQADFETAKLDFEVNNALSKDGLVAAVTLKQSKTKSDAMASVLELERQRLDEFDESARAQIEAQGSKVSQLRALLELRQRQQTALKIRAGMDGVLQRLGDPANPLQLGQQLAAGAPVARVANMARLKAAIKIEESQARDVQLDQSAEIDTRNGLISGHVVRIDPAVDNGSVAVDVALDAPLPKGARPDLNVDGTIQLERLENVLYIGRPVQGQGDGSVELFKLVNDGRSAVRVPVKLGRSSVGTMEIVSGLQAGDKVILSDMSQWDAVERLRLN